MQYAKLALGFIKLLTNFIIFLQERRLLKAGEAQALAKVMQENAREIDRAGKAREAARNANSSVPDDRSLPDDGFQRRD